MASTPPEILYQIFELVKQPLKDNTFLPQFPLTPLIRVCRNWQPVAEKLLYQSISIGSSFFQFSDFYYADLYRLKPRHNSRIDFSTDTLASLSATEGSNATPKFRLGSVFIRQLLETLESNKRLSNIVTELRLCSQIGDDDKTHNHARVLALCPNLTDVEIRCGSYHPRAREIFLDALPKKSLVSFKVCCLRGGMGLCSAPELLYMISNWPDVDSVQISPCGLLHSALDRDCTSVIPNCCPKLHTFDMDQSLAMLHNRDLLNLHRMCPAGIRAFKAPLTMDDDTFTILRDCTQTWAPTLEVLDLSRSREITSRTPFPETFSGLSQLRSLVLDSFIIDPRVLLGLPNLKSLRVKHASREEKISFLDILKDGVGFRSVIEVVVGGGGYGDDPEELDSLEMSVGISNIRKVRVCSESTDDLQ